MKATFVWKASIKLVMSEIAETGVESPVTRSADVDLAAIDPELRRRIVALTEPGHITKDGVAALRPIDCTSAWDMDKSIQFDYLQHTARAFDSEPALESLIEFAERNAETEAEIKDALAQRRTEREREQRAEQERRSHDDAAIAALVAVNDLAGALAYQPKTGNSARAIAAAIKDIKAARFERDRQAWINEHGSRHLQRCRDAGYNCLRLYATERAAAEAPGWALDFDDSARWKDRAGPSEKALDLLDAAKAMGIGEAVEIVWLTAPPRTTSEDEYEFEEREAVAIRRYLGRYDLLKNTGVF